MTDSLGVYITPPFIRAYDVAWTKAPPLNAAFLQQPSASFKPGISRAYFDTRSLNISPLHRTLPLSFAKLSNIAKYYLQGKEGVQ